MTLQKCDACGFNLVCWGGLCVACDAARDDLLADGFDPSVPYWIELVRDRARVTNRVLLEAA